MAVRYEAVSLHPKGTEAQVYRQRHSQMFQMRDV
jgi:hypothetical protein